MQTQVIWCFGHIVVVSSRLVGLSIARQPAGNFQISRKPFEQGFPFHWASSKGIRVVRAVTRIHNDDFVICIKFLLQTIIYAVAKDCRMLIEVRMSLEIFRYKNVDTHAE